MGGQVDARADISEGERKLAGHPGLLAPSSLSILGEWMNINAGTGNKKQAVYRCWMCGRGHRDAAAFLWHIRACEQEIKATGRKPNRLLTFLNIHLGQAGQMEQMRQAGQIRQPTFR